MNTAKITFKPRELFYFIFIIMVATGKALGLSGSNTIMQLFTVAGLLLVVFKFQGDKFTGNELFMSIALVGIGVVIYYFSGREGFLLTVITIVASRGIDSTKVLKLIFFIRAITFCSIVLSSLLGMLPNEEVIFWRDGVAVKRYGLGFEHPNLLHSQLFILLSLYLYLNYKKVKIYHFIGIAAINQFIYSYSGSRTGYIVTIFMLLLYAAIKYSAAIRTLFVKCSVTILPMCLIFSFGTALLYGRVNWISTLDSFMTGRIYYNHYFLTNYAIPFFGRDFSTAYGLFDNSYVTVLMQYGLIAALLLFGAIFFTMRHLKQRGDVAALAFFGITLIYCIAESYLPNIFMNLTLFCIADTLYQKREAPMVSIQAQGTEN